VNSTRAAVNTNRLSEKSAASKSGKPGQPLRKFESGPDLEGGGIDLSYGTSGFDLTHVPAQPRLRTNRGVQCCAKDGMPCSCPTCQEKSTDVESSADLGKDEEMPSQAPTAEQIPAEANPAGAVESAEVASQEAAAAQPSAAPLLVDDSATEVSDGQMKKSQFLEAVRTEICRTIEPVLVGVGQTSDGCPFLASWIDSYQKKDVAHIEQTVRKYSPDAASASTAAEYISAIGQRAVQMVQLWARMGMLSGTLSNVPAAANVADDPDALLGELEKINAVQANGATQKATVQAKAKAGGVRDADDPAAIQTELGRGQPLATGVRSRMESAFGVNFAHVRTHTDSTATGLSNRMNARAFTVGNHVAFGSGEYQPNTLFGDALIAHELAHTVQQRDAKKSVDKMEMNGGQYDALERDADQTSVRTMTSLYGGGRKSLADLARSAVPRLRSGLRLSRCGGGSKGSQPTGKTGSFTEKMTPFKTGVEGTIEFMPDPKNCPVCPSIRLVQVVRVSEKPGQDYTWTGGEANREKVKTAEDKTKGVMPYHFVDHLATGCTAGGKCSIYYRDHAPNSADSQDGSNDGTTAQKASLWDRPVGDADDIFEFETCARCATNGVYLRRFNWGFTADSSGTVTKSATSESEKPSATFLEAVAKFDKFYGN
jgi:hypothetical protein